MIVWYAIQAQKKFFVGFLKKRLTEKGLRVCTFISMKNKIEDSYRFVFDESQFWCFQRIYFNPSILAGIKKFLCFMRVFDEVFTGKLRATGRASVIRQGFEVIYIDFGPLNV